MTKFPERELNPSEKGLIAGIMTRKANLQEKIALLTDEIRSLDNIAGLAAATMLEDGQEIDLARGVIVDSSEPEV